MKLGRFFPVVGRELRVAARHKSTYWNRVLAASIALIIFFLCGMATMQAPAHIMGMVLFYAISGLSGLLCAVAGSGVADAISSEKREGTLGLLFLTNLTGYDVVAGKIAAGSLGAVYRLIAIIPVLAITFLLGGVDMDAYLRVIFGCANLMFLSLAVGVFWSSRMVTSWAAMLAWLATMVFLILGWPICMLMVHELLDGGMYYELLWDSQYRYYLLAVFTPSPGFSAVLAVGPQQFFGQYNWGFWLSLGVQHMMAWTALIIACRRTQNTWKLQEKQPVARPKNWISTRELLVQAFNWLRWRRKKLQHEEPLAWLVCRSRLGLNITLTVLAASTFIYAMGLIFDPHDWADDDMFTLVMTASHIWMLAWMAGEAATWIYRDRYSGAMELILATPLKVEDILKGHFQGLNRKFLLPVTWVVLADVIFLCHDDNFRYYGDRHWFISEYFGYILWSAYILMLFFNLYTMRWTATWMGIISRNEFTATSSSLMWLCLPTWGLIAGGAISIALLIEVFDQQWLDDLMDHFQEWHFLILWLMIASINNLVLIRLSRRECQRLREYAATRPETGFWAQLKYAASLFRRRSLPESGGANG
ncbi:MAG TPA: ABC transporter permease subunit [Verrucomicrobiae bacterium]